MGNLLRKGERLLWNDLEDCCLGPVQWDLVCLLRTEGDVVAADLVAYGSDVDPDSLRPFTEARLIQAAAWLGLVCAESPRWRRERDHCLALLAERERRARSR